MWKYWGELGLTCPRQLADGGCQVGWKGLLGKQPQVSTISLRRYIHWALSFMTDPQTNSTILPQNLLEKQNPVPTPSIYNLHFNSPPWQTWIQALV